MNKLPTYPELLEEQGGFGKYQMMVYLIIVLAINTNGYLVYGLSYLLLYPKFECKYPDGSPIDDGSKDYENYCKPDYFCDTSNNIGWSINWNDHTSLYNLTWKFNLYCASKFTGFACGSPFIPRMADIYGRKRIFWLCLFIQLLSTCSIILIPAGPEGNESKTFYWIVINMFI
jgi:hypothetical protein